MNVFKRIQQWRRSQKNVKQLSTLRETFNVLEKAEESGLIWYDQKNRRLFIEEPLATVLMASARMWKNFLQNSFTWLYWRQCSEAWESYIMKEELKAVRQVRKKTAVLTREDVERIRYARRQEIGIGDMEPPKVDAFEFFVVRASLKAEPAEKSVPGGEVLGVGSYNPETERVEMASWEEVKAFLE